MNSTTTPVNLVAQAIPLFLKAFQDATVQAYHMIWNIAMKSMEGHWLQFATLLFGIFIFLLFVAMFTRRWGSLGSFLYNFFYFGTLLIIGWVFGPQVYANDYFKIVLVLVYICCFLLVGKIIRGLGFRT